MFLFNLKKIFQRFLSIVLETPHHVNKVLSGLMVDHRVGCTDSDSVWQHSKPIPLDLQTNSVNKQVTSHLSFILLFVS